MLSPQNPQRPEPKFTYRYILEMEIQCLVGLERHVEAARMQMEELPISGDDEEARKSRSKQALRAFDLAKKEPDKWRSFFEEFQAEMPDPMTAVMYSATFRFRESRRRRPALSFKLRAA